MFGYSVSCWYVHWKNGTTVSIEDKQILTLKAIKDQSHSEDAIYKTKSILDHFLRRKDIHEIIH